MKKLKIILDPAHGIDTEGKCSPDKSHFEYIWSREICKRLETKLVQAGYEVSYTNTRLTEIGLTNRKRKATKEPKGINQTKLLLSLHNNAARGEGWQKARGVEIFTSPGQTFSDICATEIMEQIKINFPDLAIRADYIDKDIDKEARFTVLMGQGYSAILLEWLFQNNKEDLKIIQDENSNELLIESLMNAINNLNNIKYGHNYKR